MVFLVGFLILIIRAGLSFSSAESAVAAALALAEARRVVLSVDGMVGDDGGMVGELEVMERGMDFL